MNKRDTIPLFIPFVGGTKFIVKQIFHSRQGSKLKLNCEQPQKPGSPAMLMWVEISTLNHPQMSPHYLSNIILEQMVGLAFTIFQSYF